MQTQASSVDRKVLLDIKEYHDPYGALSSSWNNVAIIMVIFAPGWVSLATRVQS